MIINWSSVDLERVFAGLTRSRKVSGNKRYYEYRRNLFPYMIWIRENLDYDNLKELTNDYVDYIKDVKLGTEYIQMHGKLSKPPKKWWKELTAAKDEQGLIKLIYEIPNKQRYLDGRSGSNDYNIFKKFFESNMNETERDFLMFMWNKLGPINILYWVQNSMPRWSYNNHRRNISNMWPSSDMRYTNYPTPPWITRIKIAAQNMRVPDFQTKVKELEDKFIEGYSLDDWIKDGSPAPGEGWSYNDLNKHRISLLPDYTEVLAFWTQFFSTYYQGFNERTEIYEKWSKIMNAYNSFNPEISRYLSNGLTDLDKAFQIIDSVRSTQPEASRLHTDELNRRKSILPTEYDFNKFIRLTKQLGFNPELPTLAIELCIKCDGAGGSGSDAKIRVCSTCKGLGVSTAGRWYGEIPKLYYPSSEVSSYTKIEYIKQDIGSLLRSNDNQHSKSLNYLQQQIAEGLELLESLTPNYK